MSAKGKNRYTVPMKINRAWITYYWHHLTQWCWQKKRRPLTVVFVALLLVFVLFLTKPSPAVHAFQEAVYAVETQRVFPGEYAPTLFLFGQIESPSRVSLVATIASDVVTTPFREGDYVKAGDVLVELSRLEPTWAYEQRHAQAQQALAALLSEENRYQSDLQALAHEKTLLELYERASTRESTLIQKKLGTEAGLDKAEQSVEMQALTVNARELAIADHQARLLQLQARYDEASAQEAQARLDLSRTLVLSPFNARVAKVSVAPLQRVQPGTSLVDIFSADDLEIRTQIPSRYLAQFEQALAKSHAISAVAKVDERTIPLQFLRLSGETEVGRGGVDAFFKIQQGGEQLALGRTLEISVTLLPLHDVTPIPLTALYSDDHLFKIVDGRLQSVTVQRVGESVDAQGNYALLVKAPALKAGDEILTSLLPYALSGIAVQPIQGTEGSARDLD